MNRIKINGAALEVLRLPGATASPRAPIVFLHEGLGSVSMWRNWPAEVCAATGRNGIVYSRRGYGQSDSVPLVRTTGRLKPDYMHREALDVLPALLTELDIEKPVLLGHSDGGSIALLHAGQHPVSACVVMAPHVIVEGVSVRAIEQARLAFEAGDLRERLQRHHVDVDGAFWQWNDIWLSRGFRSFDIRRECRCIRAPVLALQGKEDPYGSLQQLTDIAPTQGFFEMELLAQCGHAPHKDQPARALASVVRFLQSCD